MVSKELIEAIKQLQEIPFTYRASCILKIIVPKVEALESRIAELEKQLEGS